MAIKKIIFIAALFLVLAIGVTCGIVSCGGGERTTLNVISPPSDTVDVSADAITFEIQPTGLNEVSVTNTTLGVTVPATRSTSTRVAAQRQVSRQNGISNNFFAFNIPLIEGTNALTIEATTTRGVVLTKQVTVNTTRPRPAVQVSPEPTTGETTPLRVTLRVQTDIGDTPLELLIDQNGDGIIDQMSSVTESVAVSYEKLGRFMPLVTVRTAGNLLFTNLPARTLPIAILSPSRPDLSQEFTNVGTNISDLAYDSNTRQVYVLSATDATIRIFDSNGALIRSIPVNARNPQGMTLDSQGNLYIADTGTHRVIKLLASNDFSPDPLISPDGSFGSQGNDDGQFERPEDVAVGLEGNEEKIFVADTGNNRIQRFNRAGVFELVFDGSDAPEGVLVSPSGLIVSGSGGVVVVDKGNGRIRVFNRVGTSVRSFGGQGNSSGQMNNPSKISQDGSTGDYIVADTGNDRISFFFSNGKLRQIVNTSSMSPIVAVIDRTQLGKRLLVAPMAGNSLIVIPLTTDPPGAGPIEVVQAFLDAVANKDLNAARALLTESQKPTFDTVMRDPQVLDRAAQDARRVRNLRLLRMQSSDSSVVVGTLENGVQATQAEFELQRDTFTEAWKLVIF